MDELAIDPITGQYKCYNCGKIFPRRQEYTRHMKRKTPCGLVEGVSTKPFQCKYCNKGYIKKQMCELHETKCLFGTPEGFEIIRDKAIVTTIQRLQQEVRTLTEQGQERDEKDRSLRVEIEELKQMIR